MQALMMVVTAVAAGAAGAEREQGTYGFYRNMYRSTGAGRGAGAGARRLFGGRAAAVDEWGAVCALLDRYWSARCSGAVLTARWALTAAHCVTGQVAYVSYNTRHPRRAEGDAAPVHYLYRHPGYRVLQEDEGRGADVTLLHHDVGLVRTRTDMILRAPPPVPQLEAIRLYDPRQLTDEPVEVLGFGRTETEAQGEELYTTRLVLSACERGAWLHCVCGTAGRGGEPRGVCAGDSGGPVVYRGAQLAVTSMGPMECAGGGGAGAAPAALTSVFTALREYVQLLNATVGESERALQMERMSAPPDSAPPALRYLAALAGASLLLLS